MSRRGPRSVDELLHSGDLSRIRTEAAERRSLAAQVRAELGEQVSAHVVSARLDDDGCLVVGMDSGAWAARLRYDRDTLLGHRLRVQVVVPGQLLSDR